MNTMAGTIDGAAGNPGMGARLRAFLAVAPGDRVDATNSAVARLLLSSFLMLFLELALIRWLGANVVHLSYFSNFVLLGSFLGIGAGFLISR